MFLNRLDNLFHLDLTFYSDRILFSCIFVKENLDNLFKFMLDY